MSFPKDLLAAPFAALGPWAPFWVALADSSFLPLAQAVDVMIVAQAMLHGEQAYGAAAMAAAGSTLGCFAAYLAARRAGPRILERYLAAGRRQSLQDSFARHGAWHLVAQTMIPLPLPMRLSLVGAGAFRMHPLRFLAAVLMARTVRYFGLAFVTLAFGERAILFWKERAWVFAGLCLAGVLIWLGWKTIAAARARSRDGGSPRTARLRTIRHGDTGREPASLHGNEQAAKELAEARANRVPAHPATPARVPAGDRRSSLGRPSAAGASDSDAPLQSGVHLLQRI
jgi:membrane protein YqaA with SNARE-associated domain